MFNSRDTSFDYNSKIQKKDDNSYYIGKILENKVDNNLLAMISEIQIIQNEIIFVLGFDRDTYHFDDVKIVTEKELIEEWQEPNPAKIIVWGKISESQPILGLSEYMKTTYGCLKVTEKGVQLIKERNNYKK